MEAPPAVQPMMYAGTFQHAMDAKNRVTIPSRWRRAGAESEEFFAIADEDGEFLMVMPPEILQGMAAKVDADPRVTVSERKVFMRYFYSRAQHLVVDKAGRILIPEEQCSQLGLRGEVVLAGRHSRFDVWKPERWKRAFDEDNSTYKHVLSIVSL